MDGRMLCSFCQVNTVNTELSSAILCNCYGILFLHKYRYVLQCNIKLSRSIFPKTRNKYSVRNDSPPSIRTLLQAAEEKLIKS